MMSATGISSSSSEHDNQETNAWSSDYSNSEDEFTHGEDGVLPVGNLMGKGQKLIRVIVV